ncbi:MAG: hypothetical protein ACRCX2_06550, partial [Paraclostridium sp.]
KELGFYATNSDNIPVAIGEWIGICGISTGEFKLCDPLNYKGALLGILRAYDSNVGKYVVDLISNIYTDYKSNVGDVVYIGKVGQNILTVTDPSVLDILYGVAGIVSEVGVNGFGRFTYNANTVQSTYIMKSLENNNTFYHEGYTPFAFPIDKDFVVSVFQFGGHGETIIQDLPAPSMLKKGTILYVTNTSIDRTNIIRLRTPQGAHVGGAQTFDVLGGQTIQFIADRYETDWLYVSANEKSLTQDDVKSIVSAEGYIKHLLVQNNDASISVNANMIQFRKPFTVSNNGNIAEINLVNVLSVTDGTTHVDTDDIQFVNAKVDNDSGVAKITIPKPSPLTIENDDASESFITEKIRFKGSATTIDHKPDGTVEVNMSAKAQLVVDDGTQSIGGVSNINLEDITISDVSTDNSTITISPKGTKFIDDNKREFNAKTIKSMDGFLRISNLGNDSVDLSRGKSSNNEGIHVALGNNQIINSKFDKSRLYFADTKIKGGQFVYQDLNTKSYILQDTDPQDDPNISGGTTFIVAMSYVPSSDEQNILTQDGTVSMILVDNNDNPLLDIDGNPMGVEIKYKAGDKERAEFYVGEVQVSAYTEVHMKLKLDFANEEMISVGYNTQLCIQSTSKEENGGLALNSFMLYTGYRMDIESRYYGYNSLNLARYLIFDEPEQDIEPTSTSFGQNFYLDCRTKIKLSVANNIMTLKDDGVTLPVFSLTKFYNTLDSFYMSGKNYKVSATLIDKDCAFRVALLQYNGSGEPTVPRVEKYENENVIFTTGWAKVDDMFISEDAVSGEHTQSKTFNIPDNSKGLAIIMYSGESQIPVTLQLKDLEGDITPTFTKVIIRNSSHINEQYLLNLKEHYISRVNTPNGKTAYRYTVNTSETKIPIGVITGGDGKIVNNNAWNDVGSFDPNHTQGDFLFKSDGKVTMSYSARCFNEQGKINEVYFWLGKVEQDGSFTKLNDSVFNDVIESNRTRPLTITSKQFTFNVKANESYRMFAHSDSDDGFYIQSDTDGSPLFKATIEFNEVTVDEKNILDKLSELDLKTNEVKFVENGKEVYNKILQYDVKTGKMSVVDREVV